MKRDAVRETDLMRQAPDVTGLQTGVSAGAAAATVTAPADHVHLGNPGDGGTFNAANLTSGSATDGHVLTADGAGGAAWEVVTASGAVATDTIWDAKGDLAVGTGADTAAKLTVGANGRHLEADSTETTGIKWVAVPHTITLGVIGTLATGSQGARVHAPWAGTITNVTATCGTAPTGASVIVDVNLGGTTIFTTQGNRPTIAATENDDLTSAPDVTAFSANDVFTIDVDAVGSTVAGANLVVQVRVTVP
jgi:hypothetical protein